MSVSWQSKRSQINHDWLKCKYLNNLDAFLVRIEPSPLFENTPPILRFLEIDFPQWEEKRNDILDLFRSFGEEMSPHRLFESTPLKIYDSETRCWIGDMIQLLWINRYPIREWTEAGLKAFQKTDYQYCRLTEDIGKTNASPKDIAILKADFKKYRDACKNLSDRISMLHNERRVI